MNATTNATTKFNELRR